MNIVFIDSAEKNYSFISDPAYKYLVFHGDEDIDLNCDKFIRNDLSKIEEINLIIIPVELNNDFVECSGLRLAHHLRLTPKNKFSFVPIIFLTDLSYYQLSRLNNLSRILLSDGVIYVPHDKISLENAIKSINTRNLPVGTLENYLRFCQVEAPVNYDKHHSIANEWALFRLYSLFKKVECAKYKVLGTKVDELPYLKTLHLKNLIAVNNLKNPKSLDNFPASIIGIENARIALIDDQAVKGWYHFFDFVLTNSNAELVCYDFPSKFPDKEDFIAQIYNWAKGQLENKTVDLFLIDLRLHPDDVYKTTAQDLTGYILMKKLKEYNCGIQIICTTASNKIWNNHYLVNIGVADVFLKEDPNYKFSKEESKYQFSILQRASKQSFENSEFYNVVEGINILKASISSNNNINGVKDKTIVKMISGPSGLLDQMKSLIKSNRPHLVLNEILLKCFSLMEVYLDNCEYIIFNNGNSITVQEINGNVKNIFKSENGINTSFLNFKYGRFDFLVPNAPDTMVNIDKLTVAQNVDFKDLKNDRAFNFKISGLLYFRINAASEIVNELLKFRYIRSNFAAHYTGNVESNFKIRVQDINFIIREIFFKILL